jgi:hypothetical protein
VIWFASLSRHGDRDRVSTTLWETYVTQHWFFNLTLTTRKRLETDRWANEARLKATGEPVAQQKQVPLRVDVLAEGTGGTTPLLDVGLELLTPDDDGLVDGAAVDAAGGSSSNDLSSTEGGVLLGTVLAEQAEVTVSDGGGTNATGGTFDLFITYTFDDDGKVND